MRLAIALLVAGCASAPPPPGELAPADVFLEDLVKPPSERCAEAREIFAGLSGTPGEMRRYRLLVVAACMG